MTGYIIRRLLWMIVVLLVISFITFVIFYLLPSADPARLHAGKQPTPEIVASLRETLGLDQPWYVQYWRYLERLVLHLDFGYSYQNNVSVKSLLLDRLPATIALAGGALVVWLAIGIPIGIVSALKRGQLADRVAMGAALVALSAPVYWVGLVSLYLFSKGIGVVPIFHGAGSYPTTGGSIFSDPATFIPPLILPWLVLAAAFAAVYARFLRSSLLEVMAEDYIRTARAKGVPESDVVLRHGLRAAITPVVTLVGLDLGILLGGAILTETVFNIPGIGRLAFESVQRSDLPTVQGTVIVGALFVLLLNLVVDIVYGLLDPRVRY